MCLYLGGGALSAFSPVLPYQMIPDLYSAEGPKSRQLFPSSSRSKHPLFSTVQDPDWEYFFGVPQTQMINMLCISSALTISKFLLIFLLHLQRLEGLPCLQQRRDLSHLMICTNLSRHKLAQISIVVRDQENSKSSH